MASTILKPAFDGLVFNWDADTWLLGASLGMDYRRVFHSVALTVYGSLTHNCSKTFDSSSGLIGFDSQVTTLDVNVETVLPTGMAIAMYPLALVVDIGYTTFLGRDRDALSFEYFFAGGLALETDLSQKKWVLHKLRLGAKAIYGEDMTGWSLIVSCR